MEPWDKYLNNLPIEEVQQLDSDYGKYFVEGIKHSTPLQRFAITQIVYYLFATALSCASRKCFSADHVAFNNFLELALSLLYDFW